MIAPCRFCLTIRKVTSGYLEHSLFLSEQRDGVRSTLLRMKQMVLNDWLHETRFARKHSAMRVFESAMTMLQESNNVSSALNVQKSRQSWNAIPKITANWKHGNDERIADRWKKNLIRNWNLNYALMIKKSKKHSKTQKSALQQIRPRGS